MPNLDSAVMTQTAFTINKTNEPMLRS